jgi:hypothetical protein
MQYNFISLILSDIFGVQLGSEFFRGDQFGMQILNVDP